MKVLFLTRATLYSVFGGDTVQITATAKYLRQLGVEVDIHLGSTKIDYSQYDLLHVFNIIRPADILPHLLKSGKPYVVSTIFVDFTEYEHYHRHGLTSLITRNLSTDKLEYIKTIARWLKNGHAKPGLDYILRGHRKAVKQIASGASLLLPNSESEYKRFAAHYDLNASYRVIYNGIDTALFNNSATDVKRNEDLVLCVARIEGNKNQLNLIKALNNTRFHLKIIGKPAPNHKKYYKKCLEQAADNISFEGFVPQHKLWGYYSQAVVHILPSWNETCGLSSLEAAYAGCNIVITNKGDTAEYYGNNAWYCEPDNPTSIYNAVKHATLSPPNTALKAKIAETYNWHQAALQTLDAYNNVLYRNGNALTFEYTDLIKTTAS